MPHSHQHTTAKPKRVPQRGLGVAQLEKIRLQEQHPDGGDHHGFAFWSQMNPNALHPTFAQFQHPPAVVSGSPGMSPQIEPPSNQNRHTQELSIVGMKRPFPISVDSSPLPLLPSFVATLPPPPPHAAMVLRSDGLLHQSPQTEPRTRHIRSDFMSDNSKLILTLAPPTTVISPKSNSDSDSGCNSEENSRNMNHPLQCSSRKQPLSLFPVEPETNKTLSDASNDAADGVKEIASIYLSKTAREAEGANHGGSHHLIVWCFFVYVFILVMGFLWSSKL